MAADDRNITLSVSSLAPRNDKLNSKAAEANFYLEKMCSNVSILFIDNARVINPKKHLINSKLQLNFKGSAKLRNLLKTQSKTYIQFDLLIHKANLFVIRA